MGSVGTFGFDEGSKMARQIEYLLQGDGPLSKDQILRLSELAVALRRVLEQPPTGRVLEQSPVCQELEPAPKDQRPLLLVATEDQELAHRLIVETNARGLQGEATANPESIKEFMSSERPDVVLLDQFWPLESVDGRDVFGELTAYSPPVPVLLLTSQDTFANRLEVARLGARGFLSKSLLPSQMLDAVLRFLPQPPYVETRVLAVDSDSGVLARLRELLEPLNIRFTALEDPLRFWDVFEATLPDLVLLDVNLPQISGIDLCRVVRNDPRWSGLPVVFLSASTDPDTIAKAFSAGGDDYASQLAIGPDLVTRINNHLARVAAQQNTAETGSSTGVACRRRSAESLIQLLHQADSRQEPLFLAVLNIDHLRQVNERYGHTTGDLVLRRFGELLLGMLQEGEQAGRWGGGEFVVGMYAAPLEHALLRLAELQEALGREEFTGANGSPAKVSFSAGVARYPQDGCDLRLLYQAAGEALRQAKLGGRILATGRVPGQGQAAGNAKAEVAATGEADGQGGPDKPVLPARPGAYGDLVVQMPEPVPESVHQMPNEKGSGALSTPSQDTSHEAPMLSVASAILDNAPPGTGPEPGQEIETADVMIVDDDEVLVELLRHALENRGYRCHSLQDGQAAIDALSGASPSMKARVVLLDVGLPGVDGLSVLRTLARTGVTQHTRVIMLTARSAEAEVLTALELGAFDHVAKPFSLSVLMQRVQRALEV